MLTAANPDGDKTPPTLHQGAGTSSELALDVFDDGRDPLSDADTHGGKAVTSLPPRQLVDQRRNDPNAAGPEGMAERDPSSVSKRPPSGSGTPTSSFLKWQACCAATALRWLSSAHRSCSSRAI